MASPPIAIPAGSIPISVKIIDNGARGIGKTGVATFFTDPPLLQHLTLSFPAYVFLLSHPLSQRKILFDLGIPSNFDSHPPVVVEYHKPLGRFGAGEEIGDFLEKRGVELHSVEAIIWR